MDRVARLAARLGSDDRLAATLNERFGTRATRQTTIRWRHGAGIRRSYAGLLAQLDAEVFGNGATPEDYDTSPARLQRVLQDALEELASGPEA